MPKKNKTIEAASELPTERSESVSDLGHCEQVQWTTPDGRAGGYTRAKPDQQTEDNN